MNLELLEVTEYGAVEFDIFNSVVWERNGRGAKKKENKNKIKKKKPNLCLHLGQIKNSLNFRM